MLSTMLMARTWRRISRQTTTVNSAAANLSGWMKKRCFVGIASLEQKIWDSAAFWV